jgi:hypothetical protein
VQQQLCGGAACLPVAASLCSGYVGSTMLCGMYSLSVIQAGLLGWACQKQPVVRRCGSPGGGGGVQERGVDRFGVRCM